MGERRAELEALRRGKSEVLSQAAEQESSATEEHKPRVAVLTMVRDEKDMLPRWVSHYGRQVGLENLVVIDDNTTDGSTDDVGDLGCTLLRVPPPPWKSNWGQTRLTLVNGLTRGLLSCFDVVVFTDADEFLVPDPQRYDGLLDYLAVRAETTVIAPLALNLLHNEAAEPAFDPERPVLEQRRFVKWAPVMCKPLIKREPWPWIQAFHGIQASYVVDPELLLIHLKHYDVEAMTRVASLRQDLHTLEGRGSIHSSWNLGAEEMHKRLVEWVGDTPADAVPEFSPADYDLSTVVHRLPNGFFRSKGPQVQSLATNPLRVMPERFRTLL